MPLLPNFIEATLMNLLVFPAPTLDMWAMPASRVILAGIRLNVFETLAKAPQTSEQLARTLQTSPHGMAILLQTLENLGYVRKTGTQYANSPMTAKWLVQGGSMNFASYFQFWGAVIENLWGNFEETIRTGKSPVNLYEWIETQPEVSQYFQEGMIAITSFIKEDVVKGLSIPSGEKKLLDVGGGHGMYAIALCQKHPQLQATIFDSPQALNTGAVSIQKEGLQNRVTAQEGNFFTDELGSGYDVILLFNIIHGLSPEQNIALLEKAKRALVQGGQVVILEQLQTKSPLPLTSKVSSILGMSYFHLLGGQVYRYEDVASWLEKVGYTQIGRKNILKAGSALISGVK